MSGAIPGPRGTRLRPIRFAEGRLSGILHAPAAAPVRRGVLICPSVFHERQLSHRTLRALADRLAADGAVVLRFDLGGTGDSCGAPEEVDLPSWREDAEAARARLLGEAPEVPLSCLGVRLGATLALGLASEASEVGRPIAGVFAWEPVLDGAAFVSELEAVHDAWYGAYLRDHGAHADRGSERGRILGAPFPARLRAELAGIEPPAPLRCDLVWIRSGEGDGDPAIRRTLETLRPGLSELAVPGPAPWRQEPDVVSPAVPARALEEIASALVRAGATHP